MDSNDSSNIAEMKYATEGFLHFRSSPAQALWKNRERIADWSKEIKAFSAAVNRPTDFPVYQWAQIAAFTLDFCPDVIVELGRGYGNSTSCFLQVANSLGGRSKCRVTSVGFGDDWSSLTVPRLRELVTEDWFLPGNIFQEDILNFDFATDLAAARRPLVFWDAHGFEVAECVLGKLLPLIAEKPHLVIVHDMNDGRYLVSESNVKYYSAPTHKDYQANGVWKDENLVGNTPGPFLWLGNLVSYFPEAISLLDFASRNNLPLYSADESLHTEIGLDLSKTHVLEEMLGKEMFSLNANWVWFTLNELEKPPIFPPYTHLLSGANKLRRELERAQAENDQLRAAASNDAQRLESLQQELAAITAHQTAIENSTGWRLLTSWRRLRDRIAPDGTRRRHLYDTLRGIKR